MTICSAVLLTVPAVFFPLDSSHTGKLLEIILESEILSV